MLCGQTFLLLLISVFGPSQGEMDFTNYRLTWDQDFTRMSRLDVSPWGPNTTWIAHKPDHEDWCNFIDPQGPYEPFNVGNGFLTIRYQTLGGKQTGGILSSVDPSGKGFSQKYGYFEMSAKLPPGPQTWPAFWLLDVPSLVDRKMSAHELDILEQYGNSSIIHSTLHYWSNSNSTPNWGREKTSRQCGYQTGFHTYGLDIQEDYLTFYFDRVATWQTENNIPTFPDKYNRPMFVLVNLAYYNWNSHSERKRTTSDTVAPSSSAMDPQDMQIEYVRVWQGQGGSRDAFSTSKSAGVAWDTAALTLVSGNVIDLKGVTLSLSINGSIHIVDLCGNIVWDAKTQAPNNCNPMCSLVFQNDGNLVLNEGGKAYWSSATYGNNMGSMEFVNTPPYLNIYTAECTLMWSTKSTVKPCGANQMVIEN